MTSSHELPLNVNESDFEAAITQIRNLVVARRQRLGNMQATRASDIGSVKRTSMAGSEVFTSEAHAEIETIERRYHKSEFAPILVAVSGIAGSGKTTAAACLVQRLSVIRNISQISVQTDFVTDKNERQRINSVAVSLDGYHRYRHELEAMPDKHLAFARRGAPFTFNPVLYHRDLLTLLSTGAVALPTFEHHVKDPVEEAIHINCQPTSGTDEFGVEVAVVEGLYTMFTGTEQLIEDGNNNPHHQPPTLKPIPIPSAAEIAAWTSCAQLYDLRLFVECDLTVATERLTKRHMAAWHIPRAEAFERAGGSDYDNSVVVQRTAANANIVLRSVDVAL